MLLFSTFVVAQNVGINTDKPTHPLHVKSTTDPIKLEGVQKDNANTSPYYLIIGDNGVVKKTIQKKGVIKFSDPNGSKSVTWNLSNEDPVEYYVIDGNANYTITLPKGVTGMKIGFYVWGGGSPSKLVFKGSRNGPLDPPSSVINYSNTGISWSGSTLTIQTADKNPKFRHTLLEFICLESNKWRFIHPIYR